MKTQMKKTSFFLKSYSIPITFGIILVVAITFWVYREKKMFREQTFSIIRKQTEVGIEGLMGIIHSQVHMGRISKRRLSFILSNILDRTTVKYLSISKDKKRIVTASRMPPKIKIKNKFYDYKRIGDVVFITKKMDFMRPPPDDDDSMKPKFFKDFWDEKRCETHPNEFYDFRNSTPTITVGIDASDFIRQIKDENTKLLVTYIITLLGVLLFFIGWGHKIKMYRLKYELESMKLKSERLEVLGLAASGLAHEVKNPLGIMRGVAQQIAKNSENIGLSRELAQKLIEEADVATDRLSDFMNYAKQRTPNLIALNGRDLILETIEFVKYDFLESGIEFSHNLENIVIEADKEFLNQIIINLLLNSLEACKSGDKVDISLQNAGKTASLIISDSGPGIPDELLHKIFKPYVSGSPQGHGIGLAIVKKLSEEMGWTVSISSKTNSGTSTKISNIRIV